MFDHQAFPVSLRRRIDTDKLGWPVRGEAKTGFGMGGNGDYRDFRRLPWRQAKRVLEAESELMARIENSSRPEDTCQEIETELYETSVLFALDLGIASSVIALSAAGCVPFTSCNGGAFGGEHAELMPLVAFCARPEVCPFLLTCAKTAKVGLNNSDHVLVVYAKNIRSMLNFAACVIDRRHELLDLPRDRSARRETAKRAFEDAPIRLAGLR